MQITNTYPSLDVGIMIMADVVYREHRPVLLRVPALGPEARIVGRVGGWDAEHDDGRALVVVNQRPELAEALRHRPLRHDVLARLRVALPG